MHDPSPAASEAPIPRHDVAASAPTSHPSAAAKGQARTAASLTRSSGRRAWLLTFSGLAALFCAGVLTQVFLAGLGLLVEPRYLAWHSAFAHLLEGLVLPMLIVGAVGRAGPRALALVAGLFFLIAMQYAFIHGLSGPFRALHLVNAFALFVVSWQVASSAALRAVAGRDAPRTSPQAGGSEGADAARQRARVDTLLGAAVFLVAVAAIALVGVVSSTDRGQVAQPSGGGEVAAPTIAQGGGTPDLGGAGGEGAGTLPSDAMLVGSRVYADNCSGCHGEGGQGRVGPELAGNGALGDRAFVRERVSRGGGIMPAFERRLTPEQLEAVVDHVRRSWGNDF